MGGPPAEPSALSSALSPALSPALASAPSPADARDQPRLLFGYLDAETRAAGPAGTPDAIVVRGAARAPVLSKTLRLGAVDGCVFEGDAVDVSPHHRAPADDGLIVGYVLDGAVSISQLGHHVALGSGELAFYDGCTPFRVQATGPYRYLVLRVRSARIRSLDPEGEAVVARDVSGHASAPLLAALLERVADPESTLSPGAAQYVGEAIAACVHAVVLDSHGLQRLRDQTLSLSSRLARWLDEHLADADVSAEDLAEAHFLSVRYVRRLFAERGTTVSAYVRDGRLDRIRDDLLDPRHAGETVAAIAARWGLRDPSVFSRAFHRRFGSSPSRFRRQHAVGG